MPLSTEPGVFGSLAWNCVIECTEDPNTNCGDVFVAATDSAGQPHAYGTCIEDILLHPEMYSDEGLVVHGTHQFTSEQLDEIFGAGIRHMPPDEVNLDGLVFHEWRPSGDTSPLVAVTINHDNPEPEVITLDVLTHMFKSPEWYASDNLTLYGTHILTEQQIEQFFPGE